MNVHSIGYVVDTEIDSIVSVLCIDTLLTGAFAKTEIPCFAGGIIVSTL